LFSDTTSKEGRRKHLAAPVFFLFRKAKLCYTKGQKNRFFTDLNLQKEGSAA